MDIIANLISEKSTVDSAIVEAHKSGSYYKVRSGSITYLAKSIQGAVEVGDRVIILRSGGTKYIVGTEQGKTQKRKEVVVDG